MAPTTTTSIQTIHGTFDVSYHEMDGQRFISLRCGNIHDGTPTVRLHSACLFGEAFHSLDCDCEQQLTYSLALLQREQGGVIVYALDEEGRGIGLANKIKSMELQRSANVDTLCSFEKLGFNADERDFQRCTAVLFELGVSKTITLISESPRKRDALVSAGFEIRKTISVPVSNLSAIAQQERNAKEERLGYSSHLSKI